MDRPMIQLYMGLLAGAILYFSKAYMGNIIALCWMMIYILILLKAKVKAHLTWIFMSFTLLSFINCHIYFHTNMPGNTVEVRIDSERAGYYLGKYNNKIIKIFIEDGFNSTESIEIGRKYLLRGEFEEKPDYPRGIIGEYHGKEIKNLGEDFIYKGYVLKKELYNRLSDTLGEEGAGVAIALSCGDSSYIDYERRDELNFLGISHIISVSGLHVSLIYNIIKKFTGKNIGLILLGIFVLFTGGKPSTLRAFIMIITLVMSVKVKEGYDAISALAFSAFIILLMKPYSILDVGYVLSFLAVLGILLFNKRINRKLYKFPEFVNSSLSLTMSSMIFTLPYMIFIFRRISLGGFISNLLLIPFYTFLLVISIGLLVSLKIPLIFNLLTYMATSVLTIITGIEKVLLNKLPMPLEFTYLQGIIILFLYLSYALIRRGKNYLKLFPIILMLLVIKESYVMYPEINFIAGKKGDIIQVIYDNKNILISGDKIKLRNIYENCEGIHRIYDEFSKELNLKLNGNYSLRVVKINREMELTIRHKNRVTKYITIGNNTEKSESVQGVFSYGNYDIIEVEKNEDAVNGRYYSTYKIIGGKSYPYYVH